MLINLFVIKRLQEKATKKRKREEMIAKIKESGGDPRSVLPTGKDNEKYKLKKRKLSELQFSEQKVVIDLGFDDQMSEKDIRSLVSQLTYMYGQNRLVERPLQLIFTEFGGQLETQLNQLNGFQHWKGIR